GALDDLADQREAVRMHAAGGQSDDGIADADPAAVQNGGFFDCADGKTRQIVFTIGIHARHFGCLATDQGTAGALAAFGDSANHAAGRIDVQVAAGEIVEEEERLCALGENVVHAHGDEVDAYGVVPIPLECQTQLGAHAVGARYQHRLAIFLRHLEKCAEPTDSTHDAFAHGTFCQWLDTLDQSIACIDVHTGVAIG